MILCAAASPTTNPSATAPTRPENARSYPAKLGSAQTPPHRRPVYEGLTPHCARLAWLADCRYLNIMKLRLLVEFDPEAKRWSAVFPELPGCASAGDTEAEAIANAREALALWFEPAPVKLNKGAKLMELAMP